MVLERDPTIDALFRVHDRAKDKFPHEYLDAGLGAIGLFLHDPPENAGYRYTPENSITFASIGVDGVHFGSITDGRCIDSRSPVVVTIPMAFEEGNFIVGESLYDFLCLGSFNGFASLANLHLNLEETLDHLASTPDEWFDDRVPGILAMLKEELLLEPWHDVHAHFHDLQSRFKPLLRMSGSPDAGGG